jgi:dipeptidyl aminopeptidase/acylaminoacyl peptidase
LVKVSVDGGELVEVTTPDRERDEAGHWGPEFLPDGRTVLFTVWTNEGSLSKARIAALDTESGAWRHLFQGAQARYAASGHIVYYTSGIYQVAPFDLSHLEVTAPAVPVLENTRTPDVKGSIERYYAFSDAGKLVAVPGKAYYPTSALVWLDRSGKVDRLPFDSAAIGEFRISPEGRRVALSRLDEGNLDIWIYDLERGTQEKLTRESNNFRPQWSSDGSRLVFTSSRRGVFDVISKPIDVFGSEETIVGSDNDEGAAALSRDGKWLAFIDYAIETGEDIWLLELGGESKPTPAVVTPFGDSDPSFSRDGAWLAYATPVSGRSEVYVQPVLGQGKRDKVSPDGGGFPLWSPVRNELYYIRGDTLMVAPYRLEGDELLAGSPRPLVDMPPQHRGYDISPDGERFLILIDTGEDPSPTEIHVTLNWFEELKRLVGAN